GMRVWYDDYTTIDWIHDFIKEKIRLRSLRNIGGIKGWFMVNYDAAQAWIVVFLIGVICGVIAAGLQIGQDYLTDLKEGYCKYNFLHRKRLCCPEPGPQTPMAPSFRSGTSPLPECDGWVTWAEHLGLAQNDTIAIPLPWLPEGETQTFDTNFTINYIAYIGFGALFAFTAALLVYVSPTVYSMDDRAPDNLRDQPSFASLRTAFLLSRPNTTSSTSAVPAAATRKPRRIIYHAAGSGIPEVKTMLGGFVIRGFLGLRTLVVKVIGLTLSVSSGLSIGVQGPLVHIGACVGNVIARMFAKFAKNEGKRREILSAACATGVSVAFGAPIGGVLFSLEDVSYYFPPKTMWRSFFCALMGAVTLKLINPLGSGKLVLFQVSYDRDWQFFELVPFMALGIFGGIYGALFIHVYMAYLKFKSSISKYINQVVDVVIVTIAVGAVSYLNPFTRVSSPQLVAALFSECPRQEVRTLGSTAGWESVIGTLCSGERDMEVMKLLAICLGLKVLLNVVSFPLKVPAGIFVPSMAVGAIAGRMLGMGVLLLRDAFPEHPVFSSCPVEGDCVIPGVYAMVGAAAALTGVTRMTVSLVVIMFELTGALSYTLPIMLAIMISKWLADFLCRASIYEKMIGLNGHPYLDQKREYVHSKTVVEVMEPVVVVPASGNSPWSDDGGFPILDDGGILVGYIAWNELRHAIGTFLEQWTKVMQSLTFQIHKLQRAPKHKAQMIGTATSDDPCRASDPNDFTQWMDQAPLTVYENTSMEMVTEIFVKLGTKTILVVSHDGRCVGVIHKKRLLAYLNHGV
ncbi:clc channel, partial [Cladochytrium replicatum]